MYVPAALITVLYGVLASASAKAAPIDPGPVSDQACQIRLSSLIRSGPAADVPAACWHVGPLWLGMSDADLTQRMGAPVQTSVLASDFGPGRRYEARVYAFPRDWRSALKSRPNEKLRLRFVEILLDEGRVVGIANDPATRTENSENSRCGSQGSTPTIEVGGAPDDFGPFQTFAGVRVGMSARSLTERFGLAPALNRSRDWGSYLPAPIVFDIDTVTRRITGFSIGTDENAVTTGADVHMVVQRDPLTCEISGLGFGG